MSVYDGVDLNNIIQDSETNELWSASSRAYDLFGAFLYDNCVEVPVEDLPWMSIVYNPTNPSEVFIKLTVDWSKTDWLKAKAMKSKMVLVDSNAGKVAVLQGSSITPTDLDTERKVEQGMFLTALSKNNGALSRASAMSGIPLSKYRTWMQQDHSFQKLVTEVAEQIKDDVEGALITTAKDGDVSAQKYFLDHRATDRGYGNAESLTVEDKQELDLSKLSIDEQQTLVKLLEKAQPLLIEG